MNAYEYLAGLSRSTPTQNAYKTPGCKYNPEGVQCDPNGRHCERCGHNPAVAAARLQKIQQKATAGYPTCLRHLPPIDQERLLKGNWNTPEATEG